MAEYYGQRAGAGLIVTEGTSPSPNGLGYPRIPGIFSDEQEAGWRGVTEAVHAAGGRIFLQLMHTGRVSHPANLPEGGEVLAPSAVPLEETRMWVDAAMAEEPIPTARAMTSVEVEAAVQEFVDAARRAVAAGFDGVELHGANGYLIEQFLHPHTNRRDDKWGGSVEARSRFPLEVAGAVSGAIGPERVGIRVSPYGVFNEMPRYDETHETYVGLARGLGEIGLAYLHLVNHSSMGAPALPEEIRPALRDAFPGAFVLSGGYDLERAQSDLATGAGDLVAFGRPFLANPDLLERFRNGAELNEPRPDTFYTPGPEGYVDYATLAG
jgi:N-ethylmaleimide reductase